MSAADECAECAELRRLGKKMVGSQLRGLRRARAHYFIVLGSEGPHTAWSSSLTHEDLWDVLSDWLAHHPRDGGGAHVIRLTVSPSEAKRLRQAANIAGRKMADWLRRVALRRAGELIEQWKRDPIGALTDGKEE